MRDKVQLPMTRFLRWTEQYTKTDMLYVARGGFFSIIGQGTGLAASLILAVAVSHFLSQEAYGMYKYVLSLVAMLSFLSLNGLGQAVFQAAAQGLDGTLKRGFWINLRWSVVVFLGALGIGGYYLLKGNVTLGAGVLIGGMLSPFIASANLFGSFLGGKKDFRRQMIYGVLDNVIPIAILIVVMTMTQNVLMLVVTYFVTGMLAGVFFFRRTLAVYHANNHREDTDLLGYSKHLSVMGILNGISTNIDQVLLFQFVGPAQLALYNFAIAIPEQMKGPFKNLNAMLQARIAPRTDGEIVRDMKNKFKWYGIAGVIATLGYVIAAPFIFEYLFPRYIDAVPYSQLYALWILTAVFDPAYVYLMAKRKTSELYISNTVYSCVQIVALLIGVMWWGLLGVIGARIVTRVLFSLTNYTLYRKVIRSGEASY